MKSKYSGPLLLAVVVNFLLFVLKLYIGLRTNSLCIYTDGVNNLLDALSISIAFIGVLFLKKTATENHPFGFGRIEYILEFVMSVIISITGISFAYNSVVRLTMPTPVWFYDKYAYLVALSCLIKLCLGFFFMYVYKKSRSDILKTIMLDSFMDTGVTAVALVSFTLSNKIGFAIDGVMGLLISIMIAVSGVKLISASVSKLIGRGDSKDKVIIENVLDSLDEKVEQKGIYIHDYGTDSKIVVIVLKDLQNLDKQTISLEIKEKLKEKKFMNVHIEWEEELCLKQNTNQEKRLEK